MNNTNPASRPLPPSDGVLPAISPASSRPAYNITETSPSPTVPWFRGTQTSEFYVALLVLAAVFVALWAGKLDSGLASVLIGLVVSSYPTLRTWLKANHAETLAQSLAVQQGMAVHPQLALALTALTEALRGTDFADSSTKDPSSCGLSKGPGNSTVAAESHHSILHPE